MPSEDFAFSVSQDFAKMLFGLVSAMLMAATVAAPTTLEPVARETNARTAPFYLNVHNHNRQILAPDYLISTGVTAPGMNLATPFQLPGYGGLSTVSTRDSFAILYLGQGFDDPVQPWYMSPSLVGITSTLSFETTDQGEVLSWKDRRFQNGSARFCQGNLGIGVVFWGSPPNDCELVDLVATQVR